MIRDSTWPKLGLKIIKSSQQSDMVKEQPDYKIIFTTSISNIRVLASFATYLPGGDIILNIVFMAYLLIYFNNDVLCPV